MFAPRVRDTLTALTGGAWDLSGHDLFAAATPQVMRAGLLREAVEAGQSAGLFRRDVSATTAAKILFGALDEMATNWMLSRRRYPLENDADTVIDLFLHGVGDRTRPVGGAA